MSSFNRFEKKIALTLEKAPFIKQILKITYQYLIYKLTKKSYKYKVHSGIILKCISKNKENFFGYYDKSPYNNGNYIYHKLNSSKYKKKIDIYLNTKPISESNSWNLQQGSMLCWFTKEKIIFNYFNECYKSKIINITNNESQILDFPIYTLANSRKFALTLNFSRLAKLRPDYGYFNLSYANLLPISNNDGIFYIDLDNYTSKLIISLESLAKFHPRKEMISAWHKVNHIMISPNNERFMFLHRWYDKRGRKYSRLITANIDGSEMHLLADDDMVSHCNWKNNEEIVGWLRKKEIGDRYYLLKDKTTNFSIVGEKILSEDGHPSFSKDEKWMITDTYPDRARMSKLLLYNLENNNLIELGEFYSPLRYRGIKRCDLHPRFNPNEKKITFDSVHEGIRNLYELDISKLIES